MNEHLKKLMTECGFELREPEKGFKYLYYDGLLMPHTCNKSDDFYEGFIEGFARQKAMAAAQKRSLFDCSTDD